MEHRNWGMKTNLKWRVSSSLVGAAFVLQIHYKTSTPNNWCLTLLHRMTKECRIRARLVAKPKGNRRLYDRHGVRTTLQAGSAEETEPVGALQDKGRHTVMLTGHISPHKGRRKAVWRARWWLFISGGEANDSQEIWSGG